MAQHLQQALVPLRIEQKDIIIRISENVHILLEIAAALFTSSALRNEIRGNGDNYNQAEAHWLKLVSGLLYRNKFDSFSNKVTYKITKKDGSHATHKSRPEFYLFLKASLQSKNEAEAMKTCMKFTYEAMQLYFSPPAQEDEVDLNIINICIAGTKYGMSQITEEFLLKKTRIQRYINRSYDVAAEIYAWVKELVETSQCTVVRYALDKLDPNMRNDLVREMSNYAISPAMVMELQNQLSEFVLANDEQKGKMFGIVCFNEFEECDDDMVRQGAIEEAQSMIKAMEDAGIEVRQFMNWTANELGAKLKSFTKDVKDRCSAVFICIMSHGHKGIVYGNNSNTDDWYSISQVLTVVEKELPELVHKVLVVQACQGNCSRRNRDALGVGKDFPHVEVTTPQTTLLMATVFGETCNRNHFIPALAKYLGRPDGKRSIHDMFTMAITDCQRIQRVDKDYDIQKPLFISSSKNIILPSRSQSL